ncbi:phytase family [Brachionus plicatilis]|uniref:Phytase family n=1 Tax=Brachionus plicatilis TaxID=10195 RepID=A0A3M7T6X9_BRAPC|nr:phytase family [Brachionus plicatilis]
MLYMLFKFTDGYHFLVRIYSIIFTHPCDRKMELVEHRIFKVFIKFFKTKFTDFLLKFQLFFYLTRDLILKKQANIYRMFKLPFGLSCANKNQNENKSRFNISFDHFFDQFVKFDLWFPSKIVERLLSTSLKIFDLSRSVKLGVYFNSHNSGVFFFAHFIFATALPHNFFSDFAERCLNKLTHTVYLICCHNIVLGFFLLQHEPHGLHIVFGMTPVSFGVNIAQSNEFLLTKMYFGNTTANFSSHKISSSTRTLVVEQNSIHSKHVISFSVVDSDPVGVKFGSAIWRSRIKWCFFGLRFGWRPRDEECPLRPPQQCTRPNQMRF